jgi:hypothetical protein
MRARAAVLIASAVLISGCSSASSVVDPYETTGAIARQSEPASRMPAAANIECPGVDIRPGASTLNITVKREGATAADLRYQLSLGRTARECSVHDGTMSIKVGVEGRVILGPFGTPGQVDVPLRFAVVREGPEPKLIVSRFKRIGVTIAANRTRARFVDVEGSLSFPSPSAAELAAYVVYVGFDEAGDKGENKPARTAKNAAAPHQ